MTKSNRNSKLELNLPPWQQEIYERAVYPGGTSLGWAAEEEEGSLVDRFEKVTSLVPNRVAISLGRGAISYDELNRSANVIGHAIARYGTNIDVPIAILPDRNGGLIPSVLGVLKAGRFLTVLDPEYPTAQLEHIVRHSRANLIITDSRHESRALALAGDQATVLNIESLPTRGSQHNVGNQTRGDAPYQLAYTSGSTGTPRGLIRSHRLELRTRIVPRARIFQEDRLALLRSLSGSSALTEAWDALLNGAALVPIDVKALGIPALQQWLTENEISILRMGSPLFRSFVETLSDETIVPTVRLLTLTSQTVLPTDFKAYQRHFAPTCVFATGLSGTAFFNIAVYYLDHSCQVNTSTVPVGYPHDAKKEIYVLDDDGSLVSPGEIGEIVLKSRYLAAGFWDDPKQTEATFKEDPGGTNKKIFHTGDMARIHPDGCLEMVGRKDFMVKIRGNRVELPAIESVLMQHSTVKEAVAVAKEDGAGNRRIAAYVAPYAMDSASPSALRSYLAERLPAHSVPSWIVLMESLPLLPGGKVDRLKLPMPASARPDLGTAYERPWSDIENDVAFLWSEILGLDRIGVNDDFLELGGDSLLAASLLAKVQKLFRRQIPLATLLQANTVRKMAALLSGEPRAARTSVLVAIQPEGTRPPLFCVPGIGGHVYALANLARRLGKEQPFYGLEPPGRDGEQQPLTRVEDIAALFVREMRVVQPRGPYRISAYSWGSRVALEMCHQLVAAGEQIAALILLDSGYSGDEQEAESSFIRTLKLRNLRGRLALRTRIRAVRGGAARATLEARNQRDRTRSPVWKANSRAGRAYRHKPYPGTITYFRSEKGKLGVKSNKRDGWAELAQGGLILHEVPGDHYTMLEEPHVAVLASKLAEVLEPEQYGLLGTHG